MRPIPQRISDQTLWERPVPDIPNQDQRKTENEEVRIT